MEEKVPHDVKEEKRRRRKQERTIECLYLNMKRNFYTPWVCSFCLRRVEHTHTQLTVCSVKHEKLQPAASSMAESTESLCGSAQPLRSKPVGVRTEGAHVRPG